MPRPPLNPRLKGAFWELSPPARSVLRRAARLAGLAGVFVDLGMC